MPPRKRKLILKLPGVPVDEVPEPEIRTSKRQKKPSARANPPKTPTPKAKEKTVTKARPTVASLSTSHRSPSPIPNSETHTLPNTRTGPAIIPSASLEVQNKKNVAAPATFVTIPQNKNTKPGPAVHPSSTTKTNGDVGSVSDGDNEGEGGNPLIPLKTTLPPPVFSPRVRGAFGQKRKQDGINTDVSDYLFSLLDWC